MATKNTTTLDSNNRDALRRAIVAGLAKRKKIQSSAPQLRLVANHGRVVQGLTSRRVTTHESPNGVPVTAFLERFKNTIPEELCALVLRYASGDITDIRISTLTKSGEVDMHHFKNTP